MRFGFLFNEVTTGLRRNITMTIAMVVTTAISVGLLGGGLLVVRLANHSRHIYLDRVESQVFITDDVSAHDPLCTQQICQTLRHNIEERSDVESVRFLTRQQAYDDAISKFPEFKDVVSSDNSPFPASFIVKLTSPDHSEAFDRALRDQPGVAGILNQKKLIDRLFTILNGLRDGAFGIALIQAIGAVLLIANMVQVAAYTRRTEVSIMWLVGARRWYIQLPFLLEAIFAAALGAILAIIGLLIVKALCLEHMLGQFYQDHLIAPVTYSDIAYISPLLLLVSIVMAASTAYFTLRLYIRR